MYCLDFREKIDLDISYESSTSSLFFVDSFIIAQEMCEMSTQTQEIIYWIHDKVICFGIRLYAADYTRQLKLCTKLHNTDPDICDL